MISLIHVDSFMLTFITYHLLSLGTAAWSSETSIWITN